MNVGSLFLQKKFRTYIMARPNKYRTLEEPPKMCGFKPFGIPMTKLEKICLKYEEYESLRLVDYLNLSHEDAANQMNVSRPTFTRIYNRAIKTIAKAFVEAKAIEITGGNYQLNSDWYRCRRCHKLIEGQTNHTKCTNCKEFNENELLKI